MILEVEEAVGGKKVEVNLGRKEVGRNKGTTGGGMEGYSLVDWGVKTAGLGDECMHGSASEYSLFCCL